MANFLFAFSSASISNITISTAVTIFSNSLGKNLRQQIWHKFIHKPSCPENWSVESGF